MSRSRLFVALSAGIAGIVVAVALGNWQTRRAEEKTARQAQWDAALAGAPAELATAADIASVVARLPQRVHVAGEFVTHATVYIDNRVVDGVSGVQLITPLAIGDGLPWVLVNRGWAPRTMQDRARLPAAAVVRGPLRLEGLAVARVPRALELGPSAGALGSAWQNLDFDAFEQASGHRVARLVVQQTSDTGDGLRRTWPRPDIGVDKHRGYAVQWYSLAALLAVLTLFLGGRAARRP
jgi:cytochrome oxidase assembly protein ShyY1